MDSKENELDMTNYGYNIPYPADDVNPCAKKKARLGASRLG